MKIIRYRDQHQQIGWGALQNDGTSLKIAGDLYGSFFVTQEPVTPQQILSPIQPTSIYCIGLNYRLHALETGARLPEYPVLFMKVIGPEEAIQLPTHLASQEVDYEAELAIVIGRTCKNVSRENALDYVLGYTCANDVSARDWQKQWGGSQWCRGKTFDTFCPLGPCLVTRDELPNPNALDIRTVLNGNIMQESNTSDMIFDIPRLIEFLSGSSTLLAGTVILTGTPSGVGMARTPAVWLKPGDQVNIEIEGIGTLSNRVILET
jgi:2-keto-4-pentenoate hydratase/2-oxohepta-3-ene-1,7-dioic acid hydratase in catechol pathway